MKIHNAAHGTVLHALKLLKHEGLVRSVPSKGVFVRGTGHVMLYPAGGKKQRIGLLTPHLISRVIRNPYFAEISWGAETVLREQGAHFYLITGRNKSIQEIFSEINLLEINGLIAVEYDDAGVCKAIENLGIPLVYVDMVEFGTTRPTIAASNHQGGAEAVKKLCALGHRKILFLNGYDPDLERPEKMGVLRLKGAIEEAHNHQGVRLVRKVVSMHRSKYFPETEAVLKRFSDCTGIIVSSFVLTEPMKAYFEEKGKEGAARYDFVCFELSNQPFFMGSKAAYFCKWDGRRMGEMAANVLLKLTPNTPKVSYLPMFISDNL